MARTISADLITEKNKLSTSGAWIWLLEAQIDDTDAIRISGTDAQVTFDGDIYYPYPMGITELNQDTEGNINSITVTVSNINLFASSYINDEDIDGRQVYLRLVHEDHLSDPLNKMESSWKVLGVSYNEEAASFRLGMVNLLNTDFPKERFFRTRCRYVSRYGQVHCGYDKTLTNAISGTNATFDPTACDGTLEGDNGCLAHGDNEVAHNLPRLHPRRFGGFPGIPRGHIFLG